VRDAARLRCVAAVVGRGCDMSGGDVFSIGYFGKPTDLDRAELFATSAAKSNRIHVRE